MPMNECSNDTVRDLLPLHVNGRLDGAERDLVESHLAACAECRTEVEVLGVARQALHHAPSIDVARIARALPPWRGAPTGDDRSVVPIASRRRAAPLWRIAAAALLVALGGAAFAIQQGLPDGGEPIAAAEDVAPVGGAPALVTFGGGLDGLTDDDLVALISTFDDEDMMPLAEPDRVFGVPAVFADEEDI